MLSHCLAEAGPVRGPRAGAPLNSESPQPLAPRVGPPEGENPAPADPRAGPRLDTQGLWDEFGRFKR